MNVLEFGIATEKKDEQRPKHPIPSFSTESGIVIDSRVELL
jgi:hypothetical protein